MIHPDGVGTGEVVGADSLEIVKKIEKYGSANGTPKETIKIAASGVL